MKNKYTTIPVTIEVKMILEKIKGNQDWSSFLKNLVEEYLRLKRIIAARELQLRFSEEVEKALMESIRSMRKLRMREIFGEDSH
ncbi:MAG: hypothetical protein ACTSX9_08385 [Candidatus Njordarchaeales archaeon]